MELHDLEPIIEALLFASDRPVTLDDLRNAVPDAPPNLVHKALGNLRDRYDEERRGIAIIPIAGGHRMVTRKDYASYVQTAFKDRRKWSLSKAALETLAIICLKEPVIVPDIDRIRGVSSGAVVRRLLELKLIRPLGRKDVIGRPILYGVGETFWDHFGLRDRKHLYELIQNLPALEEEGKDEHVQIIGPEEGSSETQTEGTPVEEPVSASNG